MTSNFQKILIFFFILFNSSCAETSTSVSVNIAETESLPSLDSVELTLVGTAVRTFFGFRVYKLELWLSEPDLWDKNQALKSLDKIKVTSMRLTALRDVEGERMKTSLKEAFQNNNVDTEKESIQKILNVFDSPAQSGMAFYFTGKRLNDDTEVLEVKIPSKDFVLIIDEPKIIQSVFSIWLGNTSHSNGLTKLKNQLLK